MVVFIQTHENKTHLSAVVLTLLHIHCIKRALAAHHHKMNQKTTDTMTFVHERYIKLTTDRSVRYVQHAAMPIIVGCQLLQSCQCMSSYERDSDILLHADAVCDCFREARGYETLELCLFAFCQSGVFRRFLSPHGNTETILLWPPYVIGGHYIFAL